MKNAATVLLVIIAVELGFLCLQVQSLDAHLSQVTHELSMTPGRDRPWMGKDGELLRDADGRIQFPMVEAGDTVADTLEFIACANRTLLELEAQDLDDGPEEMVPAPDAESP